MTGATGYESTALSEYLHLFQYTNLDMNQLKQALFSMLIIMTHLPHSSDLEK